MAHLVYLDHPENSEHKRPAWRTWRAELIFARGESSFEFFLLRLGDPRTWLHGVFCHAGFIRGRRDPLGTGLWEQVAGSHWVFGQSMFTWEQNDLGSIEPRRLWTFVDHTAPGASPLFHYYQPGSSGELKCVKPYCQMILLKLQLGLGF